MSDAVTPFILDVPQHALDDLQDRLARTRWPERETVDGWQQGVPLAAARAFVEHWQTGYDWRRCEAALNAVGQFTTEIDGLKLHFLHRRSPEPNALPIVITHGWPGSVIEFMKVIGPLTDPVAHGGRAEDAFHVVCPSLPGYGFSDRPAEGWPVPRIAKAWIVLMQRLGYARFVAQGGDWGSAVTTAIGASGDPAVAGIHLNMVVARPTPEDLADPTAAEKAALADLQRYSKDGNGYSQQQATRPQTLGYGLVDSPVGQAMWIYEKFREWTDCDGTPENALTRDEMLDDIMLYWLTGTGASSGRLYWESFGSFATETVQVPTGCSIFPKELFRASRRWAERQYPNIIHWNELPKGGHFAAFEQPELFVDELRKAFRTLR
ncbi:epoxide hydrolase family protein [Sphingomonas radiodurans]|uniref:epoxide hydrolase family protein n=1 Tax=Sphingomonas radiodurans TaxID=2890321 RepID=UPI001E5CE41B|nr:epoxide hydrolase family protein [Sphingomonas radiodurans]WBH16868.1 epoxide hydrolase [Sphingomonas radiodurans]